MKVLNKISRSNSVDQSLNNYLVFVTDFQETGMILHQLFQSICGDRIAIIAKVNWS